MVRLAAARAKPADIARLEQRLAEQEAVARTSPDFCRPT
jgi:DNA-binding GntR family transcriptional regulator